MSKIIRNWTHEPLAKRIWSQICRKEFHACNSSLQNHAYYPLPCFLHRDVIQIDLHFPWFNMGNWWCSRLAMHIAGETRWSSNFPRIFPSTKIQVTQIHRGSIENTIVQIQTPGVWRKGGFGGAEKTLGASWNFQVLSPWHFWWRDYKQDLLWSLRTPDSFEAFSRPSQILVVPLQKTL